jgi:hypothetical protein
VSVVTPFASSSINQRLLKYEVGTPTIPIVLPLPILEASHLTMSRVCTILVYDISLLTKMMIHLLLLYYRFCLLWPTV